MKHEKPGYSYLGIHDHDCIYISDHLRAGVSDPSTSRPQDEHSLVCGRLNSAAFTTLLDLASPSDHW